MDKSTHDLLECIALFAGIGILLYVFRSGYRAAARRGWVQPEDYRPSQTALGNAMLSIQSIFEPSKKHMLEQKVTRRVKRTNAGDPPKPPQPTVE